MCRWGIHWQINKACHIKIARVDGLNPANKNCQVKLVT